jgi:hypothetical protein
VDEVKVLFCNLYSIFEEIKEITKVFFVLSRETIENSVNWEKILKLIDEGLDWVAVTNLERIILLKLELLQKFFVFFFKKLNFVKNA